jgi:hypothetical protein
MGLSGAILSTAVLPGGGIPASEIDPKYLNTPRFA